MIKIISISQDKKDTLLLYAPPGKPPKFIKAKSSLDGFEFSGEEKEISIFDTPDSEKPNIDIYKNLEQVKFFHNDEKKYLLYIQKIDDLTSTSIASLNDKSRWNKITTLSDIKEPAVILSDYKYKNHLVCYYGSKNIKIGYTKNLKDWKTSDLPLLKPRQDFFDHENIQILDAFNMDEQIFILYFTKNKTGSTHPFLVGGAFLDKEEPSKIIWRSDEPLWKFPHRTEGDKTKPLGASIKKDQAILYWLINKTNIFSVSIPIPSRKHKFKNKLFSFFFKKFNNNPIISPRPDYPWESRATFNSAAVYEDGKVHFIYRALGDKDLSVLGYATSKDGLNIDYRSEEPIYIPREPFETPGNRIFKNFTDHFVSGWGYGGVEDPRITKVEDKFYMTYVAFDGCTPPRVALTSIKTKDFSNRKWDKWEKPKLISAPGMVNKNAVIFPEKINGKYVVFHRVYPNILIDFVDDLNFDNDKYLLGHYMITPRRNHWDSKKIGAGTPPIKTKDGWLFVYQSVGRDDPGRYKIGAMLLDLNDPTKVLHRTSTPIVEPVEHYENNGFKSGVVYPCGAVILNDQLIVYYGGSDSYVCAASTNINTFLHELKTDHSPHLSQINSPFINKSKQNEFSGTI